MAETAAVVQGATSKLEYSPSAAFGLGQLTSPGNWPTRVLRAWVVAARAHPRLPTWLMVYLGFDFAFTLGFLLLGITVLRVIGQWREEAQEKAAAGQGQEVAAERPDGGSGGAGWWLLLGAFGLNLAQVAVGLWFASSISRSYGASPEFAFGLYCLGALKWLSVISLLVWLCYQWLGGEYRGKLKSFARAAKIQRFSLVFVALLAVIAIVPGSNIRQQMPDVQRAWVSASGVALRPVGLAVVAQIFVALIIFHIGRLRLRRAAQVIAETGESAAPQRGGGARKTPGYLGWLAAPVVVLAIAGLLDLLGWARVSWTQLAVAVLAVPWGVALASRVWQATGKGREPRIRPALPGQGDLAGLVHGVRVIGEFLAVAVITVVGLGLVRSFTAPALLAGSDYAVRAGVAVGIGVIVAVLAMPIMKLILLLAGRRLAAGNPNGTAGDHQNRGLNRTTTAVIAATFVTADVWLIFFPLSAAAWLGVVATTVIVLGTLALGLAWLAHLAQNRDPLPLFTHLGLKSTPVMSVVVACALLSLAVGQNSQLHQVAGHTGTVLRPGLTSQLNKWLAQVPSSTSCLLPQRQTSAGQMVQVEPLLLVAAAGGGIRATWWTAATLARIASSGCGRRAVFAVSAVSGGALGAAVVATARAGNGWSVRRQVQLSLAKLAGPTPLAAGIDGLALRDNIAGLAGVDLMTAAKAAGYKYPDRAALIQQAWETADGALLTSFVKGPRMHTAGWGPNRRWQLLFNTTAVRSGCRAVIATSILGPSSRPASGTPRCLNLSKTGPPALPDSYDFLTQLPCFSHLDLGTAAMLSARFAYITPSGVVQACRGGNRATRPSGAQVEQYIDGGYVDSSGLATLDDLAPALIAGIARYNAGAVAHPRPGAPITLAVPVVVFLPNTPIPRPAGAAGVLPAALEPVLPLPRQFLNSARAQFVSQSVLMQRIAAQITPSQWLPCLPADSRCAAAQLAAASAVRGNLVVVAPQEQPGLFAVPLGWVLSQASQTELNMAIARDAQHACTTEGAVYCVPGTEGLKHLLNLIDPYRAGR